MDLVIVESPAKAKTINKYLGSNYQVIASYGHVRDLPAKNGSVLPDENFEMIWEIDAKAKKRINEIAAAVKQADRLILATDPDREGEAISWHVLQILKDKKVIKDTPVQRVVFNAVTKSAILEAMANPREIDTDLVEAYLARRALDYLVGFTLSPVLWRKLPGARSAGRVQSVALRLVCEREMEIEVFKPQEYWSIEALLKTGFHEDIKTRLIEFDGNKIQRLTVNDGDSANAMKQMLEQASFRVASVEAKPQKRNPQPPFTTSTLQQDASRKLGFSASRTMQVAQRLYEGMDIGGETVGLITYMRTDGVDMAPEAVAETRSLIGEKFGAEYVPEVPRKYFTKAKNAQEAHEAIRPTSAGRHPDEMTSRLDSDQARLYELIWKRTMASQMNSAELERTTVDIIARAEDKQATVRATGSVMRFNGFMVLYQEGKDEDSEEAEGRLPALKVDEDLNREKIQANQHFTEPPPRYTEATMIRKMEELGIGRPSTYASTLSVLRERDYVELDKKRLIPLDKGRIVTAFLEGFFKRYVEYDFTARLEEQLDQVSDGKLNWRSVLGEFWEQFSASVDEIKDLRITEVLDALNELLGPHIFPAKEDGSDPRACPKCDGGRVSLKVGKFGAFIGCSNYPECRYTKQLGQAGKDSDDGGDDIIELGKDPETGLMITARTGRFGPYVQLGEEAKPKRASLPKTWSMQAMDLEKGLALLSLPRPVGDHPETGKPISAGLGRYGPFVLHDGMYANLESIDEVFSVGINRAVSALADKASKGGGRRGTPAALKELGEHPDGGKITVHDGRYGPYAKWGKVNATLQKGKEPEALTLEEAIELVNAKASKGKKKPAAKKAAAKKPAAKKKTIKKPAAKKKPATAKAAKES
ncbi:MAG: type I DNA topoisomerase [Rhizobiales bacterium]|nr:type I DNA topoisomerase [Hyphomicrobiales bacterium]